MYGLTLQQGKFTSTGQAKDISIRSDVDWMWVYNYTQATTQQSTGRGVKFYWQRGMASDAGIEYKKADSSVDTLEMVTVSSGGFTLLDTSIQQPAEEIDGSTVTKAAPPVCTVASTASLTTGDTVRFYGSDTMAQINGLPFTITVLNGTTFNLAYINTNTANFTAATDFKIRRLPNQPQFYPRLRYITNISKATQAIITMSVTHQFTAGQKVRLHCSPVFGMSQIDGLQATIVAVGAADADGFTNTITVDIDTSSFTTFAWPAATEAPLTWASVVPIGEAATAPYQNNLDDATRNTSFIGLRLAGGAQSPAGSSGDVIYYVAGKSLIVNNE